MVIVNIIKISKSLEKLVNFSKLFKVVPPGMAFSKKSIFLGTNIFIVALVIGFSFFSFTLVAKAATCADTANDAGLSFLCKALSNCVRPESPEPNATGCGAGTVCCLGSSRPPVSEIAACGNNGTCVLPNTCGGQILSGNNTCQTNTTSGKTVCCVATAAVNYTCSGQCDDVACATAGKVSDTGTCPPAKFCCQPALAALCVPQGGACQSSCAGTPISATDCTGTNNICCPQGNTCVQQGGTGCAATCPGEAVSANDCTGATPKCCVGGGTPPGGPGTGTPPGGSGTGTPPASQNIIKFENPLAFDTVEAVLTSILMTLRGIIVILALVFLIIGAVLYILSAGNEERMKTAKNCILAAMIGLAIGIAAPSFLKEIGNVLGWNGVAVGPAANALTLSQIARNVLNFLLSIVGILGIIMLVIGGIMYLTAAGSEDRVETGKKIVIYAIIGILVALASLVIVSQIAAFFV